MCESKLKLKRGSAQVRRCRASIYIGFAIPPDPLFTHHALIVVTFHANLHLCCIHSSSETALLTICRLRRRILILLFALFETRIATATVTVTVGSAGVVVVDFWHFLYTLRYTCTGLARRRRQVVEDNARELRV